MTLDPKWTATVDHGLTDKKWDSYDLLIQTEVTAYNQRLATTTGFKSLDWKYFKAVLWVESGGPSSPAWNTRPMQIGNPGDPGYKALMNGEGASSVIMSSSLKQQIAKGINQPQINIRAGIAYALTRLAKSDMESVDNPNDKSVHDYTVVAGDSLYRIAGKVGSTVASLQKLNPTAHTLNAGQKLKYHKAAVERVITGWNMLSSANLAARYNVGDPNYKDKLDYVLSRFPKLKR